LILGAKNYFQGVNPASNNGCAPTRYVVLVTDGLPTEDLEGRNWPPLGTFSGSALGYGLTATFNGDGSLNSTNDGALTETIAQLTTLKSAGVKTYVIGLGAGVDPTVNPQASATLTAMSVAGGTGSYFPASSPTDLTNDMQAILAQILAETSATSASAINSTGISTTSIAYQGAFTTSDVYQDWTGDLLGYHINPTTGYINTAYSAALWTAQAQLDALNWYNPDRLITTWDPVTSEGIPLQPSASRPPPRSARRSRPSRAIPTARTCCSTCAGIRRRSCATAARSATGRTSSVTLWIARRCTWGRPAAHGSRARTPPSWQPTPTVRRCSI
jgi:type IV pilus assembly protein PilY1